jgi:GTP-binding protein EngB required for normal cell division
MSPLRMGSAKVAVVTAQELADRAAALSQACVEGARELEPAQVDHAVNLVDKVRERTSITGGHTVVALAGATGSGKSSLFNAIVGSPVARIGARRPTTALPAAAVWGSSSASELLDWLSVSSRHQVAAIADEQGGVDASEPVDPTDRVEPTAANEGAGGDAGDSGSARSAAAALTVPAGRLDGLVLLDLPDFDSRVDAHRVEAQRVLELVDIFVWVTDPQKYADALLHEDYVRALATHDAVTLVVLNQVDRLTPDAVAACRGDLRRLLAADGLAQARVYATSARTGAGVPELVQQLANAVSGANATRHRLSADVVAVAGKLRSGVADSEADLDGGADSGLVDALSRAAGVPIVLDAVAADYRRESRQAGGWLFTRWLSNVKADPLARLRLDKTVVSMKTVGEADVRAVLGRSSIPPPSPATRAAVSLATRQLADRASAGLPVRWAHAIADASATGDALTDSLDQAILRTPLRARPPRWWTLVGTLQWIFGAAAISGALWLTALAAVAWLQLPDLPTPTLYAVPWPFLLLAAGVILGLVTAGLSRLAARIGARRRAAKARQRLHDAISAVALERIVGPVAAVLARHARVRELLDRAAAR